MKEINWNVGVLVCLGLLLGVGAIMFLDKKAAPDVFPPATQSTEEVTEEKQTTPLTTITEKNTMITMKTSKGTIEIELFDDKAPETVKNFIALAQKDFYNGTRFHRVIKDFMIQGGDPLSKDISMRARWGTGGPGYQFKDEASGVALVRGVLAMANAGPNTNGSQFFIVTAEATPWLDGKHTAFGRVTKGMDVVDAIENTPTGQADQPVTDVVLESVSVK